MHKDWKVANRTLSQSIQEYRKNAPALATTFSALAEAATTSGALSSKTKELVALAIGISGRCDGCIGFHTSAAIRNGATREEILEIIGVAIYMGGGPSYVYGAQALEAFDQLAGSPDGVASSNTRQ